MIFFIVKNEKMSKLIYYENYQACKPHNKYIEEIDLCSLHPDEMNKPMELWTG